MSKTKKTKKTLRAARRLPTTWRTTSGTLVKIRDMTNGRLENALENMRQFEVLRDSLTRVAADVAALQGQVEHEARTSANYQNEHDRLMLSTGGLWRTKAGDLLQVRDMDDTHLDNAIRFLRDQDKSDPNLDAEKRRRVQGKKIQAEVEARRAIGRDLSDERPTTEEIYGKEDEESGWDDLSRKMRDGHHERLHAYWKKRSETRRKELATCRTDLATSEMQRENLAKELQRVKSDNLRLFDELCVKGTERGEQAEQVQALEKECAELRGLLDVQKQQLSQDDLKFLYEVLTFVDVTVDGRENAELSVWQRLKEVCGMDVPRKNSLKKQLLVLESK